ncbi:lysozyme family protein [Pseudalkalibacillus sp. R45]|uniref:lysozyme family protein n=1 Tax=Pseudalkalibacillus sp. R45 TaxID=3457433 RepID=UPI003FCD2F5F
MLREAIEAKTKTVALSLFFKYLFPFLLAVALLFGLLFMLLMWADNLVNNHSTSLDGEGTANLSQEVLQHKPSVEKYAKEFGIEEHVGILLALMMHESGGRGDDPMQASESYCGKAGCIDDPELSIKQGVKYFANILESAQGDVKLALQSYNFGSGFINFVFENGGQYTQELAIEYSSMMYDKLKHTGEYSCVRPEATKYGACYGDIYYADAVMQYHDYSTLVVAEGEWTFPVDGIKEVTSNYGYREGPFDGSKEMHQGIDFGCINHVTPIQSVNAGKVIYSKFHNNSNGTPGYGNLVMVQHGEGFITAYAHLSDLSVKRGDIVERGQQVGICGSTGSSTGPHLHFEWKTNKWSGHQNPMNLFAGKGD